MAKVIEVTNVINVSTHSKSCLGCLRHEKDVLLSLSGTKPDDTEKNYYDVFLTTEQAKYLMESLSRTLDANKNT